MKEDNTGDKVERCALEIGGLGGGSTEVLEAWL